MTPDGDPGPSTAGPLVLLVEDEVQVRRFLRASLLGRGYRLQETDRGEEAIRFAAEFVPDLVILDLGLPDLDGLDVIRRLREWSAVPVIVISARGKEPQKVAALDAGADDYLTKPFGVPELMARVRVALRHAADLRSARPGSAFTCGNLRVDLATRRVWSGEKLVHLTPIEYRVLLVLVQNAGRVVTQRHMLLAVWGPGSEKQSHYVRIHMAHLRHKLEEDPALPKLFVTEVGVGYRLDTEGQEPPAGPPAGGPRAH